MSIVQVLGVSLALAFLCESLTEYLFGVAFDHFPKVGGARWALQYVSAGAGVALAFYYGLDLIALIAALPPSWVGFTLTGLIVGRGANYLHQFASTYLPKG